MLGPGVPIFMGSPFYHDTGLMIIRRRYHVIQRAAASKKAIEMVPGKGLLPTFPSPPFADCQPRCAKSILHGSPRYDAQQILRADALSDFAN